MISDLIVLLNFLKLVAEQRDCFRATSSHRSVCITSSLLALYLSRLTTSAGVILGWHLRTPNFSQSLALILPHSPCPHPVEDGHALCHMEWLALVLQACVLFRMDALKRRVDISQNLFLSLLSSPLMRHCLTQHRSQRVLFSLWLLYMSFAPCDTPLSPSSSPTLAHSHPPVGSPEWCSHSWHWKVWRKLWVGWGTVKNATS